VRDIRHAWIVAGEILLAPHCREASLRCAEKLVLCRLIYCALCSVESDQVVGYKCIAWGKVQPFGKESSKHDLMPTVMIIYDKHEQRRHEFEK
jgi:hypothetical protein